MNVGDPWLFAPGSAHALACARIVLGVTLALRIALGPYRQMAQQPDTLFDPPPFLAWLDTVPAAHWIVLVQIVGTVAAVAAALGQRARTAMAVAWLALLL